MKQTSLESSQLTSLPLNKKKSSWWKYLLLAIFGNATVWGLVYAYLNLLPPTYTSEYAVMVLGAESDLKVSLPGVGETSSSSQTNRSQEYPDPRDDYVYITNSQAVLDKAAELMDMSPEDFGEPEITTDKESALMVFEIEGDSPEQAQEKSKLLYQLLSEKIEQLRQSEIKRRKEKTELNLFQAQQKLTEAQKKVSNYQTQSNLNSDSQITDLSVNIENLRRQLAELVAQEQGLNKKLENLSSSIDISDSELNNAYLLEADDVYQQQFLQYAEISGEFANISSQLGLQHPQVVEKKLELDGSLKLLLERASFLLGRPIDQKTLIKLNALAIDPKLKVIRQDLFKDVVTTAAEQKAIQSQKQELEAQISDLEKRLHDLSQKQLILNGLQVDLELAKAIFTETLAKSDLVPVDIDSIYPPIQLVAEPSLADEDDPTSPDKKIGILGGIAGSFLITSGVVLLWWERKTSYSGLEKNKL